MTLPEPPDGWPDPSDYETRSPLSDKHPRRAFALTSLVAVAVLVAVVAVILWLSEPAKPVVKPSPSQARDEAMTANPCAHETFDAAGCAGRMIQGAVQRAGIPPYTVVEIWCSSIFATPKARADIQEKWIAAGAHPDDARAVVRQFTRVYCPQVEAE